MARMHARVRGQAGSTRPPVNASPDWVAIKPNDIEEIVVRLGKEGKTGSQIGITLRDQYGVPLTKIITGKTVGEILKNNELQPEVPDDMLNLIRKAVKVRSHLKENNHDGNSRHNLQRIESKIRRLVKYYVRIGRLPQGWRYSSEKAALMVK